MVIVVVILRINSNLIINTPVVLAVTVELTTMIVLIAPSINSFGLISTIHLIFEPTPLADWNQLLLVVNEVCHILHSCYSVVKYTW